MKGIATVTKRPTNQAVEPQDLPQVSPAAIAALRALRGATRQRPMSGRAVARTLWPERIKEAGTSLRRGGLYRAAGAYCSKLQRRGLVEHYITDFDAGYYLSELGERVIAAHEEVAQGLTGTPPAGASD